MAYLVAVIIYVTLLMYGLHCSFKVNRLLRVAVARVYRCPVREIPTFHPKGIRVFFVFFNAPIIAVAWMLMRRRKRRETMVDAAMASLPTLVNEYRITRDKAIKAINVLAKWLAVTAAREAQSE